MTALRRLAATPAPRIVRAWRGELLAAALLAGGLAGMVTGAY